MNQDTGYRIRYRDSEFEFEVQGDRGFVEEQAKSLHERLEAQKREAREARPMVGLGRTASRRAATDGAPSEALESTSSAALGQVARGVESRLQGSRAIGGPDIALAAAYVLMRETGAAEFATRDLTRVLDATRDITVGNMSLAVRRAVERGWMEERKRPDGGRSTYRVTPLGSTRVETGFE